MPVTENECLRFTLQNAPVYAVTGGERSTSNQSARKQHAEPRLPFLPPEEMDFAMRNALQSLLHAIL